MSTQTSKLVAPSSIYIIGCGGVASYLMPALLKLLVNLEDQPSIILIDGDTLEERNLDRQLFKADQVGQPKSKAMQELYDPAQNLITYVTDYFTDGFQVMDGSLLLCCVDNHVARAAVLNTCDTNNCIAIVGGNEYTDASAAIYIPRWKGSPLDIRVRHPEILTDKTGDPTRPASCQGEAQVAAPQLAIANYSAANAMLWLLWFWFAERHLMERESEPYWPVEHGNTFTRYYTKLVRDIIPTKE